MISVCVHDIVDRDTTSVNEAVLCLDLAVLSLCGVLTVLDDVNDGMACTKSSSRFSAMDAAGMIDVNDADLD